jgi:hypothetical protein
MWGQKLVFLMANRKRDMHRFLHGNGKGWKGAKKKANQQRHKVSEQSYSMSNQVRQDVQKFDLHNHSLHQAKKRIKEECSYAAKDQTIQFCHGFNSGTQIRDFIRNGGLQQSLNDLGIQGNIWAKDDGNTYFNRT